MTLLFFQVGTAFEEAADAYVRTFLNKGIPSLFSDMKALYRWLKQPSHLPFGNIEHHQRHHGLAFLSTHKSAMAQQQS